MNTRHAGEETIQGSTPTAGSGDGGASRARRFLGLTAWVAFSFLAALSGRWMSTDGWYAALEKPAWNPPAWIFGPVWSALYLMMGVAAWRVWCRGGWTRQRDALALFVVQWVFNALWTPIFFAMHNMALALLDLGLLWLALAGTMVLFWRADRWAGLLLVPYLAWVTFAGVLNFTLWRLNTSVG